MAMQMAAAGPAGAGLVEDVQLQPLLIPTPMNMSLKARVTQEQSPGDKDTGFTALLNPQLT